MSQRIAHIALVVDDYDKAIDFYVNKLDFILLEDTKLSEEKRWVMVAPNCAKECSLLLAKAANPNQAKSIARLTRAIYTKNIKLFVFGRIDVTCVVGRKTRR